MAHDKRSAIVFHSLFLFALLPIQLAAAQSYEEDLHTIMDPIVEIICMIFDMVVYTAGAVAILVIVIAGVKWLASSEDPAARKNARGWIQHAVIGLIIVLVANTIVLMVGEEVWGENLCGTEGGGAGPGPAPPPPAVTCADACTAAGFGSSQCRGDFVIPVGCGARCLAAGENHIPAGDADCNAGGDDCCCCG